MPYAAYAAEPPLRAAASQRAQVGFVPSVVPHVSGGEQPGTHDCAAARRRRCASGTRPPRVRLAGPKCGVCQRAAESEDGLDYARSGDLSLQERVGEAEGRYEIRFELSHPTLENPLSVDKYKLCIIINRTLFLLATLSREIIVKE